MRRLLFTFALLLLAAPEAAATAARPLEVRAVPVTFDPARPGDDRVGQLRWLGGLALTSDDSRFGGFSGLLVAEDGAEPELLFFPTVEVIGMQRIETAHEVPGW